MTTHSFMDDFAAAISAGSDIPEGEYFIQPVAVECKTSKKAASAGYEYHNQLVVTLAILGDVEDTSYGNSLRGRAFNIYPTDGSHESDPKRRSSGNARFFGQIVSLGVGHEWYADNRETLSKMDKNEVMEAIAAALVGDGMVPRVARVVRDGNFYKPVNIRSLSEDMNAPDTVPVQGVGRSQKNEPRVSAPALPVPTFGDHDDDAPGLTAF